MNTKALDLLKEMQQALFSFSGGGMSLEHLVERLLVLRDQLNLEDKAWSHEFTQNVVTLDSASVETPTAIKDAAIVKSAVEASVQKIGELVQKKLIELASQP